jgi:hypothetical protein
MKARVFHLHKTEAEWLQLKDWVPGAGELIIYDPDENYLYPRIKLGNGEQTVQALPFLVTAAISDYMQNHRYPDVFEGGRIINYKK